MRDNLGKAAAIFLVIVGLFYLLFLGASALTDATTPVADKVKLGGISILGGFVLLIGPMLVKRFPLAGPAVVGVASLLVAVFWPPMVKLLIPLTILVAAAAVYQGLQTRRNMTAAV